MALIWISLRKHDQMKTSSFPEDHPPGWYKSYCKGQSANWATLPPYTAETGRSRWSELMCMTRLNKTWFPKLDTAGWRRCRWDERQKTRRASWCYSIDVFWLVDKVTWWHSARGEFRGEAWLACYQLGQVTWSLASFQLGEILISTGEKTTCRCVYVTQCERGISLFAQPVDGEKGLPRTSVARYYWLCYAQIMRDGRSALQPPW